MIGAAGELVGQRGDTAHLRRQNRSACRQFDLQVRAQPRGGCIVPRIAPLTPEVPVLVEGQLFALVLDQADPGQRFGHLGFQRGKAAADLGAGGLARIRQYHLQIRVLGHAFDQPVGLGQAGATTEQ